MLQLHELVQAARGARLLTETASARLATAIDIPFDQLGPGRGYDAKTVSWNFPALWTGGRWSYGDIVRYQTAASWALFLDRWNDALLPRESRRRPGFTSKPAM